ncbi:MULTISPECIES: NAD(P)-dependent oxidoreductase [unclassified Streptomyces]|uniref:NAD(P)-dependent oxidoreductase n=1 Tax=unclassified Streptomyces TaxID=2593676 RepID=UPI002366C669|nr:MULTISPECIES: NAD(P)-dependent oxidoreductase [unclassified Streptomyces]MDF3139855.1 NAD(P)-dependent oxidoreductase [Streptomyces sp. T21Q-yed]WDF41913.1 NAD(P)-dependent oxidoreductase [Streptomyces sp. T12]
MIIDGPGADGDFVHSLARLKAWVRVTRTPCSYASEYAALQLRGVAVRGGTPGRSIAETAEFSVLMMLMLVRRAIDVEQALRGGDVKAIESLNHATGTLGDETVGLVGLGRVGKAVTNLLTPYGPLILHAARRSPQDCCAGAAGRYGDHVPLSELLARSTIVSLHLRDREGTWRLGEEQLAAMRRDAILINTAQGRLVDETALCAHLERGRLRAAGLDVFEREPLPADSPLRSAPNLLLTPHIAGKTRGAAQRLWKEACEAVIGVLYSAT